MQPIKGDGNTYARIALKGGFSVRNNPQSIGSSVAGLVIVIPINNLLVFSDGFEFLLLSDNSEFLLIGQ